MVKIKFNTIVIGAHTGYGNASRLLQKYLYEAGVEFVDDVVKADVVLNFCMPKDYIYGRYTIGYTPWESTSIPNNWMAGLKGCDDLWTTSGWTAEVFKELTRREAFVLPHGIEPCWVPYRRRTTCARYPFTFLHVGEPAVRKGGDIVLRAWYKRFRNDTSTRLIFKSTGIPMARVKDSSGSIIASPVSFNNVELITSLYTQPELQNLYESVNCLVYPTRGEGFGLIPLEAMATGLPTILPTDGGTREFSKFGLPLRHFLWRASNEAEHPGLWMDHDVDEVIHLMETVKETYDQASDVAYHNAHQIHLEYDWETVARSAIDRIESKLTTA